MSQLVLLRHGHGRPIGRAIVQGFRPDNGALGLTGNRALGAADNGARRLEWQNAYLASALTVGSRKASVPIVARTRRGSSALALGRLARLRPSRPHNATVPKEPTAT